MSNFTFQLESMSVDISYSTLPEYPDFSVDTVAGGDATIELQMGLADISGVFMFATDASDIDDISNNDIIYTTASTKWNQDQPLDVFGISDASSASPCVDGENSPFTTNQTGAGEYVRHLASEITGGYGGSDIFSNEAVLLTAVENLKGEVHDAIQAKIDLAGANGGRFINDNFDVAGSTFSGGSASSNESILGHTLLTQLLTGGYNPTSDMSGNNATAAQLTAGRTRVHDVMAARSANSGAPDDVSGAMYIPIQAGDILSFNVVVTNKEGNADLANGGDNTSHSVGANAITARTYKVNITIVA